MERTAAVLLLLLCFAIGRPLAKTPSCKGDSCENKPSWASYVNTMLRNFVEFESVNTFVKEWITQNMEPLLHQMNTDSAIDITSLESGERFLKTGGLEILVMNGTHSIFKIQFEIGITSIDMVKAWIIPIRLDNVRFGGEGILTMLSSETNPVDKVTFSFSYVPTLDFDLHLFNAVQFSKEYFMDDIKQQMRETIVSPHSFTLFTATPCDCPKRKNEKVGLWGWILRIALGFILICFVFTILRFPKHLTRKNYSESEDSPASDHEETPLANGHGLPRGSPPRHRRTKRRRKQHTPPDGSTEDEDVLP